MPNRPCRRAYDHRLRDLICEERNPALFAQLGIPRSTAASWIRRGSKPVVTTELFGQDEQQLRARVLKLERRVQLLLAVTRCFVESTACTRHGCIVSLIPMGGDAEGVTAQGLEWELDDDTLRFGQARGVSNVLKAEQAHVRVRHGSLLCVVQHASR